jgi:hypothetical protein
MNGCHPVGNIAANAFMFSERKEYLESQYAPRLTSAEVQIITCLTDKDFAEWATPELMVLVLP